MQRIMVIGCCGAGKTTLSRHLHKILRLPLYHLDQYFWKSGWQETDPSDWVEVVKRLAANERWIIDGNYGGTMDIRMAKADTIIYLKFPTIRCLSRVISRIFKNHGKVRYEMPEGCAERFDWDFLHYVATFRFRREKNLLNKLKHLEGSKKVFILSNDRQVQSFLKQCFVQEGTV